MSRFPYPITTDSLGVRRRLETLGSAAGVAPALAVADPTPSPLATGRTILIAEDHDDGRCMMKALLELKGYNTIEARNGMEAIELALADRPDLILLDLRLPEIDGLGVARYVRKRLDAGVPIIIMSGWNPSAYIQEALNAGCNDYLLKPIDFDRLEEILDRFVPLATKLSAA